MTAEWRLRERVAKAICHVLLNGGDPDQPAVRWNGTEMEPQDFPAWRDYLAEADAAIAAMRGGRLMRPYPTVTEPTFGYVTGKWIVPLSDGSVERFTRRTDAESLILRVKKPSVREMLRALEGERVMWVYIQTQSGPALWTVGFYSPEGKWQADSDFDTAEKAADRVHWLNGGSLKTLLSASVKEN